MAKGTGTTHSGTDQSHQGTHDMMQAKVGDEYEPIEITVTEEMVVRRIWANDDYNPWYMEDSPFGGRIVPPLFLATELPGLVYSYYATPPGGHLHAKQEFEFINPLRIGKKVKITGRLVDRYNKRGRDWFVSEALAVDEDGVEIVRMRRTEGCPAVVRS